MAEASQHDDLAEILAEASQQQQQDPTNIVARLKRAYVNEKNAPELLPFEHDLLEQVMAKEKTFYFSLIIFLDSLKQVLRFQLF